MCVCVCVCACVCDVTDTMYLSSFTHRLEATKLLHHFMLMYNDAYKHVVGLVGVWYHNCHMTCLQLDCFYQSVELNIIFIINK